MGLTEIPFQGESMNPLLKNATGVLVDLFDTPEKIDTFKIKPGEIVLYKESAGNEWICHRFIGNKSGASWLKGDYNTTMETKQDVVVWGIVRGFVRDEQIFGMEKLFAANLLCYAQRKQCEAKSYFAKKFYRSISLFLLFGNRVLSIRKYNHLKS